MDPQQTEQLIDAPGVPPMCIRTGIDGTTDMYVEKSRELQAIMDLKLQHPDYQQHPDFESVWRPYYIWSEARREQQRQADASGITIWRNWFAPEVPYQDIASDTDVPDLAISLETRQLTALRIDPFSQNAVRVVVPVDVCNNSDAVIMKPHHAALRTLLGLDIMSRTHARPYESASHSEGQLQIYYAWSSSNSEKGDARIPGWNLSSSSYNAMRHMLGVALIFQRQVSLTFCVLHRNVYPLTSCTHRCSNFQLGKKLIFFIIAVRDLPMRSLLVCNIYQLWPTEPMGTIHSQ